MSFRPRSGEWLILPVYQIFGGEELSAQSPPVQERSSSPFLLLRSEEVERLGLKDGGRVHLEVGGLHMDLPIQSQSDFPRGAAGCSIISRCRRLALPAWGRVMAE
ncbi:MAG: hypothetical protein H0W49_03000 [Nitrospirales bacterium]|nr:hypothetical protein [Nitrospirales bacterium]